MAHDTNELVVAGDLGITRAMGPDRDRVVMDGRRKRDLAEHLRSLDLLVDPAGVVEACDRCDLQHDEECDDTDDDGLGMDEEPQEGGDGDRETNQREVEVVRDPSRDARG